MQGTRRQARSMTRGKPTCAGLLSFLWPAKQAKQNVQLVNDVLRIASQTEGGAKVSEEQRQEINNLVTQLANACFRPEAHASLCTPLIAKVATLG